MHHNFSKDWDEKEKNVKPGYWFKEPKGKKSNNTRIPDIKPEKTDFKKMDIPYKDKTLLCALLDEAVNNSSSYKNFKEYLSELDPIIDNTGKLMHSTYDYRTIQACDLVRTYLETVKRIFGSKNDEFFEYNSVKMKWFKKELVDYFILLKIDFNNQNFSKIVDDTSALCDNLEAVVPSHTVYQTLHELGGLIFNI